MDFYKRMEIVCSSIPYGRAATYGQISMPVSYTHLDVYKRQFLILYRRNQNRHGILAWIIAAILYDFIHFHDLSVGWELAVKTLLCIPFFLFAVRMERETEL